MANTKVTGDVIANGTISTVHLADDAITAAKLDSTATGITFADLTVDTDTLYVDAANNRVGIGTGSPDRILHIESDSVAAIQLENTSEADSFIDFKNPSRTFRVGYDDSADLFKVAVTNFNSNAFVVNSSGNIGIGTSSPDVKLHIVGDGDRLEISSADYDLIKMGAYGDSGADLDNGFLNLLLDGSEKIRLLANGTSYFNGGNVGIGTTSPNRQLSIYGTNDGYMSFDGGRTGNHEFVVGSDSAGFIIYDDTIDAYRFVIDQDSGNVGIGTTSPTEKLHVDSGDLKVRDSGNVAIQIISSTSDNSAIQFGDDGDSNDGRIVYENTGDNMKFFTLDAEKMRIDSSGNVGINETDPSGYWGQANNIVIDTSGNGGMTIKSTTSGNGRLVFTDTKSATAGNTDGGMITYNHTDDEMRFQANGSQKMVINSSGSVGIGTDSPLGRLHLYKNDHTLIRIVAGDSSIAGIDFGKLSDIDDARIRYYNSTRHMEFFVANGERMRINSSGNVGIGTTSPVTKLHVSHTVRIDDAYGLALVENTSTSSGSDTNSALNIKSKYGTSQFMQWENQGLRIGSRITDNSAPGDVYFTAGSDSVKMVMKAGGNVGIGETNPTRKLDVAGEITHEGLVPKAGAFVDGLVTINKTVSISANTWTSLGISLSDINGSGTFAVQVYSNAHGSTGANWYSMYWSGIMSWYHNSANATDINEVPLHAAGHAMNGNTLEIRTKLHIADGSSYANRCELQIKTANALSSAPISFRFRKLL